MSFLAPLALALAALGVPILILYMLKLRRQEHAVSSTMLWQQVLRDQHANAPWQRLRRNLLLLLQLLLLFLLVLALGRPYSEISRRAQGNIVVLLDASASMQATDVKPSRFEAARTRCRQLVDGLGANDTMTLIAVADVPHVLSSLTNDRAVLRQALSSASVTNTQADWEAAAILAAASARQAARTTVVVLSDGGLPADLPSLPGTVQYVPIGITGENLAIAALAIADASPPGAGAGGPVAFVRVSNLGAQPATPLVELYTDGALFDARTLSLPPGQEGSISWNDLPLETHHVQVRLAEDDALAPDNTAWAVRAQSRRSTAILATPGNTFLERAVGLVPHLDPITVRVTETLTNAQIVQPTTPPALTIYDGVLPERLPSEGSLLFVNPPASTALFTVRGTLAQPQIAEVMAGSPLLQYVDLDQTHIARAQQIDAPGWAQPLVSAQGGPLLLAGEVGGQRVAILAFDLHQSNLPLQIAFPILVANLGNWLAPASPVETPAVAQGIAALRPGMPVVLWPPIGVSEVVVRSPSGVAWTYPVESSEPIPFGETQELGIYQVEQRKEGEMVQAQFAVNLFSEAESDIEPRDRITIGEAPIQGLQTEDIGRREWWRWPAIAGLVVLLVEWIVYWRRQWVG
jgi:Ca-activated chloride channel family protein